MRTVHEVSKLTGVSIRTLQYYDRIGLLPPSRRTEADYRLYDDAALARLQEILFFRELEFSLREIGDILKTPGYDRGKALERQIGLLTLKREHLDELIALAERIKASEGGTMEFTAFDKTKIENYKREAKKVWGGTEAYREFEEKNAARSDADEAGLSAGLMAIFGEFGAVKTQSPASPEAQVLVRRLQEYISEHFYRCTAPILASLGAMYAAGGEMTDSIDAAGGAGTAAFAAAAIEAYAG